MTPSRTSTPTITLTPSNTSTPTQTHTRTHTPTLTLTPTPTQTLTPSLTPTPTVTNTPTDLIRVAVGRIVAPPGTTVELIVELVDKTDEIVSLSFDLLLETAMFTLVDTTERCFDDERLDDHGLAVSSVFGSDVPVGFRRFRFVLFNNSNEAQLLGSGPAVHCFIPVRDSPPIRNSPLRLARVLPLDAGGLIRESLSVHNELVIDPSAPTSTPTSTPTATATASVTATASNTLTATATASSTPTATPSVTATATPSDTATASNTPTKTPSPTQTQIPCEGDCDGNGRVTVAELVRIVQIGLGAAPVERCDAGDRDRDGVVSIAELIAAVNRALTGCPAGAL